MRQAVLVFILSTTVLLPLLFNSCQGPAPAGRLEGGSTSGNPIVELQVAPYSAGTDEIRVCIEEIVLEGTDGSTRLPFIDFEVNLDKIGTLLGRHPLAQGHYHQVQMKLTDRCGTGYSIQVVNTQGTFAAADALTLNFDGASAPVPGDQRFSLNLAPFAEKLSAVTGPAGPLEVAGGTRSDFVQAEAHPLIMLDEFSFMRRNGLGERVWRRTLYANQTLDIIDGFMRLQSAANEGLGWAFQTYYQGFLYPQAYTQSYVKANAWNPGVNRLRFSMRCANPVNRQTNGDHIMSVTVVHRRHDEPDPQELGLRFSHEFDPSLYANRVMTVELNRVPQRTDGDGASIDYPDDPTFNDDGIHYFDGLTRFYLETKNIQQWRGQTCYFDDVHFDLELGEADELVSSITSTYTGTAYEVTWATPKTVVQEYEIRYAAQSMKGAGFASGTDGGTVRGRASGYTSVVWTSPAMAQAERFFVAIRPVGSTAFTEIEIK